MLSIWHRQRACSAYGACVWQNGRVPCWPYGGCTALLKMMLTCSLQNSDRAERTGQLYHVGGTQAATPNVYDVNTVPSMREFTSLVCSGTKVGLERSDH